MEPTATIEPVTKLSADVTTELKERLAAGLPEFVVEGELATDRLLALLGQLREDRHDRYTFTWAGKQDAIRLLQTPTAATLAPDRDESVNFDDTTNIFIEGDNLEVLKLLYKPYFNRVKMIYIDPPYNTGNDFIYPDDFRSPLDPYLELIGQLDSTTGNRTTNLLDRTGRLHSSWLSMMYPRLFIARQLLSDDGVIFISIDDGELHNLRLLMNEIFGEENFVSTIIWEKKYSPQNDARWLSDNHDYVLLYARNKETWRPNLLPRTDEANARYTNPDNDPRGPWKAADMSVRTYTPSTVYPITTPSGRVVNPPEGRCWVVSEARFKQFVAENRIWFGADGSNVPALKKYLSEVKQGMTSLTIWGRQEVGDTQSARRTIKELFGDSRVFDTPKPIGLIQKMLLLSTSPDDDDIVLDFFAGSASTAHAVLQQNEEDGGNRRFIMVQLPEPVDLPDYQDIAQIGRDRIRRAAATLDDNPDLDTGFRAFSLYPSNFRQWDGSPTPSLEDYSNQLSLFVDPLRDGWHEESVIYEIAIKQGLNLSSSITQLDSVTANTVFRIADDNQCLYICLDPQLRGATIPQLKLASTDTFICRDAALTDDLAANLALTCNLQTL